jgi:hypothetical protein
VRTLYLDTDGAYLQDATTEEFSAFVKWCNAELYPRLLEECGCRVNKIAIAYEKAFARIVFPRGEEGYSAKKYCGRFSHYEGVAATADSEPEVKGLACKRGDSARLARRMQEEVIELLMRGECEEPAEFDALVSRWRARVMEGELSLDDVKRSQALSRAVDGYLTKAKLGGGQTSPPVHVVVAEMLRVRGEDVSEGTRIEYVIVDGSAAPLKAVPAADYDGAVDRTYLWNRVVWPPSSSLLAGAFPGEDWDRWLVVPPKLRGGKPVPAEQAPLFGDAEPIVGASPRRAKGRITVRIDHRRKPDLAKIKAAIAGAPGPSELAIEIRTPKGLAELGSPSRVEMTAALERELRALGAEVFR